MAGAGQSVGRVPGQPIIYKTEKPKEISTFRLVRKILWRHKYSIVIPTLLFACIIGDYRRTQRDKATLAQLGLPEVDRRPGFAVFHQVEEEKKKGAAGL